LLATLRSTLTVLVLRWGGLYRFVLLQSSHNWLLDICQLGSFFQMMAKRTAQIQTFQFPILGGAACLDFANTLGGIRAGKVFEHLHDYVDLLAWAAQADLLTKLQVQELQVAANRHPNRAKHVLMHGLMLREAIYRIFSALAARKDAPTSALSILNNELVEAMTNARIVQRCDAFDWQLPLETCGMSLPLYAVARDAALLLTSVHLTEVGECARETCGWLFLDTTRNHSRLWCDMRLCGNRAKQARLRSKVADATAKGKADRKPVRTKPFIRQRLS
jgi:predicted RNA-binding Zn ribbon-like protein